MVSGIASYYWPINEKDHYLIYYSNDSVVSLMMVRVHGATSTYDFNFELKYIYVYVC